VRIELEGDDGKRMKGVRLKERRGGRAHDCFSFSLLELIALSRGPAKFGGRPAMQEMGKFGLFGFGLIIIFCWRLTEKISGGLFQAVGGVGCSYNLMVYDRYTSTLLQYSRIYPLCMS
jgi:hypothetical protein